MPTIQELPVTTSFSPSDQFIVAQGTVTNALAIGTLLQAVQPLIVMSPGTLLGRCSPNDGAVELVVPGAGLSQADGTLSANGHDHLAYGVLAALDDAAEIVVNANGAPARLPIGLVRSLFTGGSSVNISPQGVLSATQFRVGAGPPAAALGFSGDSYLDVTNGDVWNHQGAGWLETGLNILAAEASAWQAALAPLVSVTIRGSGLSPVLLADQASLALPPGRGLVRITGSVATQDVLSGDVCVWDLAVAVKKASGSVGWGLVGTPAITVFAQDAAMASAQVRVSLAGGGISLLGVGVAGRQLDWTLTILKAVCP